MRKYMCTVPSLWHAALISGDTDVSGSGFEMAIFEHEHDHDDGDDGEQEHELNANNKRTRGGDKDKSELRYILEELECDLELLVQVYVHTNALVSQEGVESD
jgi:hypothetical protein